LTHISVRVEPAVYGRDPAKVRAAAEQYGTHRTSTRLEELIDAPDVDVIDNCLVNAACCRWRDRSCVAPADASWSSHVHR
jgi:hypothetical protein